jgi:translation initiation factor 3 subunit K
MMSVLNRLDVTKLGELETKASKGPYDADVNNAVLKLYKFNSARANKQLTVVILIKALVCCCAFLSDHALQMNLPYSDFTLCLYLLPQKDLDSEPIASLTKLAALLEACQFKQFWLSVTALRKELDAVPGFDESVRKYIMHAVSSTFQTITVPLLSEFLNVKAREQVEQLVKSHNDWRISGWRWCARGAVLVDCTGA